MINPQTDLIVYLWGLSILLEFLAVFLSIRLVKRLLYSFLIIVLSFCISATIATEPSITAILVALFGAFRVFNSFRVIYERINPIKLSRVSKRTSLILIVLQSASILAWLYISDISTLGLLLMTISVLISMTLLLSSIRNIKKAETKLDADYISDKDLPSVSVCVPARNETALLSTCLDHIVKSDYPKLEVLVLDDCSQDKTSEIIKGYAHSGVRFIPGDDPRKGWLAKNQAYESLAEASSGKVIIFCGVDVRLDVKAIRSLIVNMINKDKQMISVLPKSVPSGPSTSLLQPMRYWWELVLPRRLFNRPPVLSTVWAIDKKTYLSKGGMKSVKNSVMPEGYFAREILKTDGYSFMRSSGDMNIGSAKPLRDQIQTSIRTRYPRLRNRPENIALLVVLEVVFLLGPFLTLIYSLAVKDSLLAVLSLVSSLLLLMVHFIVIKTWGVNRSLMAVLLLPVAVISEIVVTLLSMWRYEFSQVKWKDRDICIPVMKNYPKLPKA